MRRLAPSCVYRCASAPWLKALGLALLLSMFFLLASSAAWGATDTRVPTGNDAYTGTWSTTPAGTAYWDAVNDPVGTPDDGTTNIFATTVVGSNTFTFSAFSIPTGSLINGVTVYFRHQAGGGGGCTIGPVLKVGGNYYTGAFVTPTNGVWAMSSQSWSTNPKTGAAWTLADVNGTGSNPLQAFGVHTNDVAPDPYATQVYVEVNYTPRVWDGGGGDNNWNTAANWSADAVPAESDAAFFNGTSNKPCTINITTTVASLTVTSASTATITLATGNTLTVTGSVGFSSGTFDAGSNLFRVGGNWTVSSPAVFNANTSTVQLTGAGAQTLTSGAQSFAHLEVSAVGGTYTLQDALTVSGNLILSTGTLASASSNYRITVSKDVTFSTGTLTMNASTMAVAGNWAMTPAGTFNRGTSTITFNGSGAQQLSGSTTFYALRALTPGATLQFAPGATSYVVNMVEFRNIGLLSSGVSGTTWYFSYTGSSQTLTNLRVRDSNAAVNNGLAMNAYTSPASTDLGNNTNWNFLPPDTGVRYWIAVAADNWNSAGNWSTGSGGLATGGVPVATHTVVFDSGGTGNCNINTTVSISSLSISGYTGAINTQGYALTVASNTTQTSGTLQLSTSVVTFQGDLTRTGGTFDAASSSIQFTGGLTQTITPNATGFYHVVINKTGGSLVVTGALDVGGNWTKTAGTVTTTGSTVKLTGTGIQQLSGSTTFYGLRALANGATLQFAVGTTQYVTNMVEFRNVGLLSSGASGTTWYFSYTGSSQTLSNLRVRDSNASPNGGTEMAAGLTSTNLGNNTNWSFAAADVTAPSAVTNLTGLENGAVGPYIRLSWTAPGDDAAAGNLNPGFFRIFYSTLSADMTGLTASSGTTATRYKVDISTSGVVPATTRYYTLTGLLGRSATYYIRLFTGDEIPNWSALSNACTSYLLREFDPNQIEVDGLDGGLNGGGVAWGDFDNDVDLDILASGEASLVSGTTDQLRVYKNNGNGTFDASQIEVDGLSGGLRGGGVAWGDFDNDGDLDILAIGSSAGTTDQLRVYKNNGNGTFDAGQIEVDGLNGGLNGGEAAWGDFDNDGDLDILASGMTISTSQPQLRVYKNNGNGTFDASQIEVDGLNGGLTYGGVAWGDFDNDGDLDILVSGDDSGPQPQLRVYKNNGNGTFDANQIEVDGLNGGLRNSAVAWGDLENDGDLDILASGYDSGNFLQLRVYKNNGNGTFDASQIEVTGYADAGLVFGAVAWGDFDNDGDLDILGSGQDQGGGAQLQVWKNNGNGTFDASQIEVDGPNGGGLDSGAVAWGDFDNDGDLDILAIGNSSTPGPQPQLRVYVSRISTASANAAPSSPANPTYSWEYGVSKSTLTFKWDSDVAYDTGFSANSVYFNLWAATSPLAAAPPAGNEASVIAPRQGSPLLGNYLRAANKTWPGDGSAKFGVYYTTTPGSANAPLVTDASYYFRVQSIDAGLSGSAWTSQQVARSDVAPSAITNLAALPTSTTHQINLSWTAVGDDQLIGNINPGTFRVFYSSVAADVTGLTATAAPTSTLNRTDISTSAVTVGSTRYHTLTNLLGGTTFYIRVFTGDEVPNWSAVSNAATSYTDAPAADGPITSCGTGNWHSTIACAPWPSGIVPTSGSTVTIAAGHVVTATAPVTITSMTVASTGELDLDGANQAATFTLKNGGKITNSGAVKVSSANYNVTLQGESGGSFTFEGTDIDYNTRKLYLGRVTYQPAMSLASGETVELSGNATLGPLTTASGAGFIVGANNILTLTGNTSLAAGTFTKGTGSAQIKLNGTIALGAANQNLGVVATGP